MTKILLIEDEEPIRRVLTRILTAQNTDFDITEAEDGKMGFDLLSKGNFDLVLCDIKMPKMDGIEVLKKIKRSGVDPTLYHVNRAWKCRYCC